MIKSKSLEHQQGYLLLVAVALIMIVGFLGVTISYMSSGISTATVNLQLSDQAFYVAESGLEIASRYYLAKGIDCASLTGNVDLTNATVGSGKFTVTSAFYTGSSTLSSAITASATTIPANSTASFGPSGFITIDGETMTYTGVSGNNFTGVARGYNNTTPASHNLNAAISQNQCTLISTGGVPNLTSPRGKRILVKDMTPQASASYYAVGDSDGSTETILKYNGTTWVPVTPAVSGTINLLSVSLETGTLGWAVGNSTTFYKLTGSSWAAYPTSLTSATYNTIFCIAPSNCITLGSSRRSGAWNGTTWSQTNLPGGLPTIPTLQSVHCNSSSNCWTVGNNTGTKFYQGTGTPFSWTGISQSGLSAFTYNGVYCSSANDCWAVGANATFARKNGASWADFASGMPAAQYNSIYCTSSSNCWAVGNSVGTANTIVQWNGTAWTKYTTTNPIPSANFNSISCSNANDCWAVGGSSSGGTAFIYYNGSAWSQVSPSGMPAVILRSVAVTGAGAGGGSSALSIWLEQFS